MFIKSGSGKAYCLQMMIWIQGLRIINTRQQGLFFRTSTLESPLWCRVCDFAGKSFEDFSTHLKSGTHGYWEWDLWASKKRVDRTFPENFVWGRSKLRSTRIPFSQLTFIMSLSKRNNEGKVQEGEEAEGTPNCELDGEEEEEYKAHGVVVLI
ncbi:uncharacterized protein LOC112081602 [Eutrema salsugineum]|uniref:uncharacterized protein LOC112081602 n=1 Tax=Eutrema salsugineum TaxID=72664 RepID=UPI000CED6D3E|nr:uncharacterized protein LOC112081602 [Eutrema salsugineum]